MNQYLTEIRSTLAKLEGLQHAAAIATTPRKSVKDAVQPILMSMGMVGESGSRDIITIMENLASREDVDPSFPSLKEVYEAAARAYKIDKDDIAKEVKAIEQRLRRALSTGLSHLASIGLTDYGHPKFEHYAPLYFDFEDVRQKMKDMEQGRESSRVKVNIKKFLQVLYFEVQEQLKQ
nr:DNA-binding domain-containing protein [Paenibacillus caui]